MESPARGVTKRRLKSAVDVISDAVLTFDRGGVLTFLNPAAEKLTGWTADEATGRTVGEFLRLRHENQETDVMVNPVLRNGITQTLEADAFIIRRDGREVPVAGQASPILDEGSAVTGVVVVFRDLSEVQEADHRHAELQERLRQTSKMEAIGRLAGGVAHDFNNLLTAISGYCDMLLRNVSQEGPACQYVEEIQKAASRATSLTHQLLAFSRRQIIQPKVLDLNAVITDTDVMLRRLIGEDIDLILRLDPGAGCVKADQGQIGQILMNLAVNARDAMTQGGTILIRTAHVSLSREDLPPATQVKPGPFVMFSMTDSGSGMDKETLSHLFEPFFTTKEPDKGTGLGLSTVYGIVEQCGGCIKVDSVLKRGTCFRIYLPQHPVDASAQPPSSRTLSAVVQGETILLVEDDATVRTLVQQILRGAGYSALIAENAQVALQTCRSHPSPIHLMVTDLVMPGMNGRELSEKVNEIRPDTKILFMSGYTDDIVFRTGLLTKELNFLQKPFTPKAFARKVREILDAP